MLANLLRRGGPLLALTLVIAAAVASLFGPVPALRLVGSWWFLAGAGIVALAGLLAAILAITHRSWVSAVRHLGLVVALIGIAINQRAAHSSYLFLEQGAGTSNIGLSRDLRQVEELPQPLTLDSVTTVRTKAFQPAPIAWLTNGNGHSSPVTYNRPLTVAGRHVLLSQTAAPGFLTEYEIALDGTEYLLLHNQVTEPSPGLQVWSFAYDAAERKVGLLVGNEQRWLGIGDSTPVAGGMLRLTSATFAARAGAIFTVNDARYRFIIFLGFGLMLLSLLPPLLGREAS